MSTVASADITALADALRETAHRSDATTFSVLVEASDYIANDMKARAPVDSGKMRDSIGVTIVGQSVVIGPDAAVAPYAGYVEDGTKPHEIRPRNKKALAFTVNGQHVVVKKVHHPGTKAQPFVLEAFQDWAQQLGQMVAAANVQVLVEQANQ